MGLIRAIAVLAMSIPRNGVTQNLRLANYCLFKPIKMRTYPLFLFVYKCYRVIAQKLNVNRDLDAVRNRTDAPTHARSGYGSGKLLGDLLVDEDQIRSIEDARGGDREVVLAEIDQDGDWCSRFGELRGVPTVSKDRFQRRKRYRLQVVLHHDEIAIKKHYGRDKVSFVNEVRILDRLAKAGCNVPTILEVDVDGPSLTVGYVEGDVLREQLARCGAKLRDRDVAGDETLLGSKRGERRRRRIEEGRRVLHRVIDEDFTERAFAELSKIHAQRVVWRDVKYGNMIIARETSAPYFIDFDSAYDCLGLSEDAFNRLRDSDIEKFNEHFGTEKLTYEGLSKKLKNMDVYAPVYFGAGVRAGPIWRVDNGFGRWHYILKRSYPQFSGKRVLDLGANNGHNAMQLLREGAREVVGIELDEKFIEQAKTVRSGYEWADNRRYNFRLVHANMADVPRLGLGKFDIVQALCSLYYLSEEEMKEVARFVATISDHFILQCNVQGNIGRDDPRTYEKATVEFAINLLEKSGFTVTKVVAPFRYSRPLVIGSKRCDRS